jgi:hypothetical protein
MTENSKNYDDYSLPELRERLTLVSGQTVLQVGPTPRRVVAYYVDTDTANSKDIQAIKLAISKLESQPTVPPVSLQRVIFDRADIYRLPPKLPVMTPAPPPPQPSEQYSGSRSSFFFVDSQL